MSFQVHTFKFPDVNSPLEIKEKLLIENEREHIYLLKNNVPFAWYEGEKDYVNLLDSEYIKIKNSDIYHNHLKGYSFSREDISMTIEYNARSITAVTSEAEYIVERPGKSWGFKFKIDGRGRLHSDQETIHLFEEAISTAEDMLHRKTFVGELTHTDKILAENHYIWDIFFELKSIKYKKHVF
jgi:hypothetical protein